MIWFYIILSVFAGLLLGGFFFGGLWWTVQRITCSGRPYLLSVASFLIRTTFILIAFYFLLQAGWSYLLAALAGFLVSRTVLAYKLEPKKQMKGGCVKSDH